MKTKLLILIFTITTFISCDNFSKESLEKQIKEDLSIQLIKDNRNAEVESVLLVHKKGNEYVGMVKLLENGIETSHSIQVVVDGEKYVMTPD